MAVGETLLKISDYPFAYSFVFIIAGSMGMNLTESKILLLGIAGVLGTFLGIVDPVGMHVRRQLKKRIEDSDCPKKSESSISYEKSAIHTRGIGIEIDKIITMIYFAITAVLFLFLMFIPQSHLSEKFLIHDNHGAVILDSIWAKGYTVIGCLGLLAILSKIGYTRWKELDEKVEIAGIHQQAIGNDFATENSVENMTTAIDFGDWATAKEWGEKIKKEIEIKKGKRELIIKASESVYAPLFAEFIKMEPSLDATRNKTVLYNIIFTAWSKMKQELSHLAITDSKFVESLDTFEKEALMYNALIQSNKPKAAAIILEHASKIFGKKIVDVTYIIGNKIDSSTYHLSLDTLSAYTLNSMQPTDERPDAVPRVLNLTIRDDAGNERKDSLNPTQMQGFSNDWHFILDDVNKIDSVKQMKALFDKLSKDVVSLKNECEKANRLKYQVF